MRLKAQFELVRRDDITNFRLTARRADQQLARIHSLWGIAQLARKDPQHAALLAEFLTDPDPEMRAQAARSIGDVRDPRAADSLLPLLDDPSPRARFFAAEALGRLAHQPAVPGLVKMLADNDDRDVTHEARGSLAFHASATSRRWPPLPPWLPRRADRRHRRVAADARSRACAILEEPDEQVVTEAARAINDDGSIEAAVPALAADAGGSPIAASRASPRDSTPIFASARPPRRTGEPRLRSMSAGRRHARRSRRRARGLAVALGVSTVSTGRTAAGFVAGR